MLFVAFSFPTPFRNVAASKSLRHRHKYPVLKRRRAFVGDASKWQVVPEPQALRRCDASKGVGEGRSIK